MQVQSLPASHLPWPAPWSELFNRPAPLLVEVGFGGGHFLVDLARRRSSANVLGCEISLPSLRRGEKKRAQLGLENLIIVQGEAELVLWALCRPGDIDALYINFPDPWPKARHHGRRLINDRFLKLAATRLKPDAHLDIATDHAEYAAVIADCLAATPYFDSRLAQPYVTEDRERLRTKYELTALAAGRTCHYFKWHRNHEPVPNLFPVPQELPMPHIILETPLSLTDIAGQFKPNQQAGEHVHVRFIDLFHSDQEGSLLIEANISEEPLSQRVGLSIRARPSGELIIGLHELGFPRPTEGVHQAIGFLADWLLELQPGGRVVKSNIVRESG